jgi:hypothetical protein
MSVPLLLYDRNRGDGDDDPGEPEVALMPPIKLLDDRMVLGEIGKGGIRKHERPIEDFVRVDYGRQESLNVAAVKNRLLLVRRMLLRVDGEDVADARQILRSLVESGGRQLVDLRFIGNHFLCCGCQVHRRSQAGFLHCQAVLIHIGALRGVGDKHDVMGRPEGRIVRRRSAHIDDVSASCVLGAGLDHAQVFQCARLPRSDETYTV